MHTLKHFLLFLFSVVSLMALFPNSALAANDEFYWNGKNYGRGVGVVAKIGGCAKGEQEDAGLCYKECRQYYKGVGPVCWLEAGVKSEYGRGAGYIPKLDKNLKQDCKGNDIIQDGLCYDPCRSGFHGRGPLCYNDNVKAASYGRGVGAPLNMSCTGGKVLQAGLCYDKCRDGYDGVGPVCWGEVPKGYVACGMGFARSKTICTTVTANQVIATAMFINDACSAYPPCWLLKQPKHVADMVKAEQHSLKVLHNMTPTQRAAVVSDFLKTSGKLGEEVGKMSKAIQKGGEFAGELSNMWKNPQMVTLRAQYKGLATTLKISEDATNKSLSEQEEILAQIRNFANVTGFMMLLVELWNPAVNVGCPPACGWALTNDGLWVLNSYAYTKYKG